MSALRRGLALLLVLLLPAVAAGARTRSHTPRTDLVEVVVTLAQPPLAEHASGRSLLARGRRTLDLRAPASVSYVRTLSAAQNRVASRIQRTLPGASIRWRYTVVADGLAVVLPAHEVGRLRTIPGVASVFQGVTYGASLNRSVPQIGAPSLWGPTLATAGQGMKIAIIDQGVDPSHPFLSPAGLTMPRGFPKGQKRFTTAKVIVARAFPPPNASWKGGRLAYHGDDSTHGTHVAGIAAGDVGTVASSVNGKPVLSGVAPKAYIGNYNALDAPTDGDVGLDGNSPELVAAVEAAVKDGMDVINMSLREAEIEPSRDIVALALDAAAKAGVVPVVATGNEFTELGRGSIGSPATAASAIAVAAVSTSRSGPVDVVADFSSSGPSSLSLRMKPDVAAPGVAILSSTPGNNWDMLSGTSMAAPHVAGAAALLRQRHPAWTVEQIKSALEQSGDPAFTDGARTTEAPSTREGGGVIDLPRADNPLLFASPTGISFGLVGEGATVTRTVDLSDAGGGGGEWAASVQQQTLPSGSTLSVPPLVTVPGSATVTLDARAAGTEGEVTGFVVLTRGADRRRIPFWGRVTRPLLGAERSTPLTRPGLHAGNNRNHPAKVSRYRYPETPTGGGISATLAGPEQVFSVRLTKAAANFGVAITSHAHGVRVEPRIVAGGDENRLEGETAIPLNYNPYLRTYGDYAPAAGVIQPRAGAYDVVFDSPTAAGAGPFTFRFWVNDRTPPSVTIASRAVHRGRRLVVRLADAGSGVDPTSLRVWLDGTETEPPRVAAGRALVPTTGLEPGRHALRVQVSDYQETRNMENTGAILPNTRVARTTFVVR